LSSTALFIVGAAAIIWFAGFYDDLHKKQDTVIIKLASQLTAALMIVLGADISLQFFPSPILNNILSVMRGERGYVCMRKK